jgi:hypothetical protein
VKYKTSKYLPKFFLISFFISFSFNICLSANFFSNQISTHTKDHLHFNEKVFKSSIDEILIEENENELEFDLALSSMTFFLEFYNYTFPTITYTNIQSLVVKTTNPLYLAICNFRV